MQPLPPLTRAAVDRDAGARVDDGFPERFDADPEARVLALRAGRMLLAERVDGSAPALELRHPSSLPEPRLRLYLGRAEGGAPIEARVFDDAAATGIEAEDGRWAGLREAGTLLGDAEVALATEAIALATWHERNPFCPRCGGATESVQRGWARRCLVDDSLQFPRTDPAVIVLVTDDDDRVLLGSNAMWATGRFSLLAGFVEPGESFEAAVVREIREEAGIAVDRVAYRASQPWPFPASLMVGLTARVAAGVDPQVAAPDGEEILELRWFTRAELAEAAGDVVLPGAVSIARWLLEGWYGGELPGGDAPWTAATPAITGASANTSTSANTGVSETSAPDASAAPKAAS